MKLQTYLTERRISYADFAVRVGAANRSVIAKWVAGTRVPRQRFMAAIVRETGGEVQPNDFLDLEPAE